jgi:hypothetical protein
MTNLTDRLDSFTEGWKPKPGDKLIGTVTDLDSRESEYHDEPYRIVTVEAEEGSTEDGEMIPPGTEKAWHAFHTTARGEIEKRQPAVGDHVGIAYHGPAEKAAPGMSPAERWRLIVDKRGAGNEAAPEPEPSAEEEEDSSRQEERPQFETDDVVPF